VKAFHHIVASSTEAIALGAFNTVVDTVNLHRPADAAAAAAAAATAAAGRRCRHLSFQHLQDGVPAPRRRRRHAPELPRMRAWQIMTGNGCSESDGFGRGSRGSDLGEFGWILGPQTWNPPTLDYDRCALDARYRYGAWFIETNGIP
jgi:hypothetical protein